MLLPNQVLYLDYCLKERYQTFGEEYFARKDRTSLCRVTGISSELSLVFVPFKNLSNTLIPYISSKENFASISKTKFLEFKERRSEVIRNRKYKPQTMRSTQPTFPILKI